MLGRDESSILIDYDGNPTQRYPISWTDLPIQIGKLKKKIKYEDFQEDVQDRHFEIDIIFNPGEFFLFVSESNPPYVIAVLPKYVEVRTVEPRLMIQNIPLAKAHTICQGR